MRIIIRDARLSPNIPSKTFDFSLDTLSYPSPVYNAKARRSFSRTCNHTSHPPISSTKSSTDFTSARPIPSRLADSATHALAKYARVVRRRHVSIPFRRGRLRGDAHRDESHHLPVRARIILISPSLSTRLTLSRASSRHQRRLLAVAADDEPDDDFNTYALGFASLRPRERPHTKFTHAFTSPSLARSTRTPDSPPSHSRENRRCTASSSSRRVPRAVDAHLFRVARDDERERERERERGAKNVDTARTVDITASPTTADHRGPSHRGVIVAFVDTGVRASFHRSRLTNESLARVMACSIRIHPVRSVGRRGRATDARRDVDAR